MGVLALALMALVALLAVTDLHLVPRLKFLDTDEGRRRRVYVRAGVIALCLMAQTAALCGRSALERRTEGTLKELRALEKRNNDLLAEVGALEQTQSDLLGDVHRLAVAREEADARDRKSAEAKAAAERDLAAARSRLARRDARLRIVWTPLTGRSVDLLHPPDVPITADVIRGRRQYLFTVENDSGYALADLNLRLQWPFPVSSYEPGERRGLVGPVFQPLGTRAQLVPIGGGSAQVLPGRCTATYGLTIDELRPKALLELFLTLYNGRTVPIQTSPSTTYASGAYRYPVGTETARRSFYAPFEAREDGTVVMGAEAAAPKDLAASFGSFNCSP